MSGYLMALIAAGFLAASAAEPLRAPDIENRDLAARRRQAVSGLIQALKDHDENVRAQAAEEMGKYDPPALEAVDPLIAALKDPAPLVRNRAAESLQKIGTKKARKAVMKYRRSLPRHPSW